MPDLVELKALLIIVWRQGIKRNTRFQFWNQLFGILRHNSTVLISYITMCALLEHHIDYRQIVQNEIEGQIADYRAANLQKEFQQVGMSKPLVI